MATAAVTNTVKLPDGTAVTDVQVTATLWPLATPAYGPDQHNVALVETVTPPPVGGWAGGTWTITLERTDTMTPSGMTWQISQYSPSAGWRSVCYIAVGAGGGVLQALLANPVASVGALAVGSVTAGDSSITIGGTAANPSVALSAAIPGARTFAGLVTANGGLTVAGAVSFPVGSIANAALASAPISSLTAADATAVIGGTGTNPTVRVGTIAESQVTNLVTDLAAKVTSVTAGDASLTAGGTATAPTLALAATVPGARTFSGAVTFSSTVAFPAASIANAALVTTPVTAVTAGSANAITIGGTATAPTVDLLSSIAGARSFTGLVTANGGLTVTGTITVPAASIANAALVTAPVTSVAAGDSSLTAGGTATAPTLALSSTIAGARTFSGAVTHSAAVTFNAGSIANAALATLPVTSVVAGNRITTANASGVVTAAFKSPFTRGAALAETFSRETVGLANVAPLTSGLVAFAGIWLPIGTVVTSITFHSATTAAATPTAQWFGLFDNAFNKLQVTTDDTTTAWPVSTAKTLNLASTFTTTYSGIHYLGVMVAATTVPTLVGLTGSNTTQYLLLQTPVVSAQDTAHAALTTPASCPAALTASAGSPVPYAYCS